MKVRFVALAFGFFLMAGLPMSAMAGPLASGTDTDSDGIDQAFDNCTAVANADQADVDHDGCGDACEVLCDSDADGSVKGSDFLALSSQFLNDCGANPSLTCTADCDGDNAVKGSDFLQLSVEFLTDAGPSGITNSSRDLSTCPL